MDTCTLVESLIKGGQKLIEELRQRGFDVAAAFWLRASENGKWYFYIVSPVVDAEGAVNAYRRLHPLVWAMPQPFSIDPLEIKLIGPKNPIAQDVLRIQSRPTAARGYSIGWPGKMLGNVYVDEAYLYPLPATTP
jgi:hypothetical protein